MKLVLIQSVYADGEALSCVLLYIVIDGWIH